ncbi:MAG: hypothetical protein PHT94_00745 [Candidatus Nanoarchaeia archaeon]|nr:hypothetical protein [Candidatus Nanoarchaeia archaeon]
MVNMSKELKHIYNAIKNMDADTKIEFLDFCLPHGSGFDIKHEITEQKKNFEIRSSFHCMDENGYYCGWVDFTAYLWKDIPSNKNKELTVYINGKYSNYLADKYFLRNYIKEEIFNRFYFANPTKFK